MYGFWGGRFEKAFLDIRVFNPCAPIRLWKFTQNCIRKARARKRRQYEQRVREVERASLTPNLMSTTGGMGKSATIFYKRLATMLSEKRVISYSQRIHLMRYKLSFALLRAFMSIRVALSSRYRAASETEGQ